MRWITASGSLVFLSCLLPPPGAPPGAPASSSVSSAGLPAPPPRRAFKPHAATGNAYSDRFIALWNDLHNPQNGYFSAEGIPYHAPETLLVEAPDYGHETTSEAYSYWIWLEAMYGKVTGDYTYLADAWASTEAYIIPTALDQPTAASYTPQKPAQYTAELDLPNKYPAALEPSVNVGQDPIAGELHATYGDANIYGMHWIVDVDNWYGFGRRGDGTTRPSYFNTFQRGVEESVFETVPQPSWDEFKWGGQHGYLDLYVKDSDAQQWKYTVAPDADARAIQAMYFALIWSQGSAQVKPLARKAAKMGDYLRYAFFDKYFKALGCTSRDCPAGEGRGSAHYLLSWYYAWGGSTPGNAWAWRIGSSHAHSGYQNPLAAFALSRIPELKPSSPNAASDWGASLTRQLGFYRWLQSAEGAIAGGATNAFGGVYAAPPKGTPTFYGMAYDPSPVFHDPPSNEWFGFQCWSMERVAEYFWASGDPKAKLLLDRWVAWALKNTTLSADGAYLVPSTLNWTGAPGSSWDDKRQNFDPNDKTFNAGLHVIVKDSGDDVGVAASLAHTLTFYAARTRDPAARKTARELLDRIWAKYRDAKGVSSPEVRKDYKRFNDVVALPAGWKGKMPNGDAIDASSTFLSIRSKYRNDPDWPKVEAYLKGGEAPRFTYHRFWTQAEIAIANGTYGWLFPSK